MNLKIPVEIQTAIADGIAKLLVLRLRGSPAHDTVKPLIRVWIETMDSQPIRWDVERDLPRVVAGFQALQRAVKFWPAPSDFWDAMPPRKPQLSVDYKAKATMSESTQKLLDGLLKKLKTKPKSELNQSGSGQ